MCLGRGQRVKGQDYSGVKSTESGVMLCRHCDRAFVRQQCLCAHKDDCVEQLASHVSKRKTAVLRPAADLPQDQVHSVASLSIGQGNLFRGQESKEMFFPKTIKFFPRPAHVTVVKEGWACKGVSGVKGGAFKRSVGRSNQDGGNSQGQG